MVQRADQKCEHVGGRRNGVFHNIIVDGRTEIAGVVYLYCNSVGACNNPKVRFN